MPAAIPQQEIGYARLGLTGGGTWWQYDPDETTPELQWPQSVAVYDQMRKQDAQVGSVLEAVTRPVLRTPWRLDPAGARAEVVEFVADDLGLPIVGEDPDPPPRMKDRFSWLEHLELALLMLPFGHMFFEQVYRVDEGGDRAHLRKLGPRMPRTIEQVDVARDGGLISIKQYGMLDQRAPQRPIPVNRLVAYVYKREGGNWLGRSILRQAYKNWMIKDRLLRVQAQTIERNGMGIPLYEGSETTATQGSAASAEMTVGLAMAKAWRSGEASGAAVPHGAKLRLVGVEGDLPDANPAIRYHDEQIARAVLAHFLNLGTQTGSWALGTTFADFFTLSLQTLAQQVADTATMHIVEDLVDVNFGEKEPAPRITFDEIGSRQAATAQSIKSLVDAGVIEPDEVLEQASRQQYGLPPRDPDTARGEGDPKALAPMGPTPSSRLSTPTGQVQAAGRFNPALHPRDTEGRFRTTFARIINGLQRWAAAGGKGDPFEGFSREQVRRAATRDLGLTFRRGAAESDIKDAFLGAVRNQLAGGKDKPDAPKPAKKAAKKAAPAKKAAKKAQFDAAEVAARVSDQPSQAAIVQLLAGDPTLTAAKLRKVADELDIDVPDGVRAKSALQLHIAEQVARDRDLPSGFDAPPVKKAAPALNPEQKVRAEIATHLDQMAKLFTGREDFGDLGARDSRTAPKLAAIAKGLRDGSISDKDASDRLAALSGDYEGSVTGDNLKGWARDLAPAKKAAPKSFDAELVAGRVSSASSREEIDEALDGLTVAQLRQVGAALGSTSLPSRDKAGLRRDVAQLGAARLIGQALWELEGRPDIKPEVTKSDPKIREIQAENLVRERIAALRGRLDLPEGGTPMAGGETWQRMLRRQGNVSLADLRESLPDLSREEFDATVRRLSREDGFHVYPQEAQGGLRPVDRTDGVEFGGQMNHWIQVDREDALTARPLPKRTPAGGSEFGPGGAKHLDVDGIAEGLGSREDFVHGGGNYLDDVQKELDAGVSPAKVARGLDRDADAVLSSVNIRYGGHSSSGLVPADPKSVAERQRLLEEGRARAAKIRALADRLRETRRPRAAKKAAPRGLTAEDHAALEDAANHNPTLRPRPPATRPPGGRVVSVPGAPDGFEVVDTGRKENETEPVYDVYREGVKVGTIRKYQKVVVSEDSTGMGIGGKRRNEFEFRPSDGSNPQISQSLGDALYAASQRPVPPRSSSPGFHDDVADFIDWEHMAPSTPAKKAAPDLEQKARDRQSKIDTARGVSDLAAQVLGDDGMQASPAVMRKRITDTAKRLGTPDSVRDELLDAVDEVERVEVENKVHTAYSELSRRPGDWVPLADLRERLAGLDRREQDRALESLALQPGVQIIPWDNFKALGPRDHAASLHFGGQDNHAIRFEDSLPRPASDRLHAAVVKAEKAAGLTRIGDPGETGVYTPAKYTPVGGGSIKPGTPVVVVRPGYEADVDGERVRLSKATVEEADAPKPEADVAATRERIKQLRRQADTAETLASMRLGNNPPGSYHFKRGEADLEEAERLRGEADALEASIGKGPEPAGSETIHGFELDELVDMAGLRGKSASQLKKIADENNITIPSRVKTVAARQRFMLKEIMDHESRRGSAMRGVRRLRETSTSLFPPATVSDATPDVPGTSDLPADFDTLTNRQKRARLRKLGFSAEQIDELAPLASAKKAAPTGPRPSGLPTDRKPVSGDFEDLAERVFRLRTEDQVYELVQDLNKTELTQLARKFPGDAVIVPGVFKTSDRRQGLKLPEGMSLDELRRWFAQRVKPASAVRAAGGDEDDDLSEFDDDEDYEPTGEDWLDLADADPDEISAAAGRDITPGRERLHHYWTRGKGLARWVASPHPWTTLVALLSEHVSVGKAKRFASKWFKEVFGIWPGERKGDNPVGPG